jgi:hypothetical protein
MLRLLLHPKARNYSSWLSKGLPVGADAGILDERFFRVSFDRQA